MSLSDPVADFLARIRNAIRARHQKLDVPASKLKTEIARILKELRRQAYGFRGKRDLFALVLHFELLGLS